MTPLVAEQSAAATTSTTQIPESMRTKCEIWTRVMGYHRPTSQFNIGKKQEAAERKYFLESKITGDEECECEGCEGCGGCN